MEYQNRNKLRARIAGNTTTLSDNVVNQIRLHKSKQKPFVVYCDEETFSEIRREGLQETTSCESVNNFVRHFEPRNFSFVPYLVEICHKIRHFYQFRLRLSQRFKTCFKIPYDNCFDVNNSCKRVVGLIYRKKLMS